MKSKKKTTVSLALAILIGTSVGSLAIASTSEQAVSTESGMPANVIGYNEVVGIFAEDGRARLDIGLDSVKKEQSPTHESWATRFYIKRLDGPSEGPVTKDHLIAIVAEDGRARLDIGAASVKLEQSPSHESWATRLRIVRLDGESSGPLMYGHLVGVFAEDGRARLDIGLDSMKKEQLPTHESWATRLRIR